MPGVLPDPRQEKFAQIVAEGVSSLKAAYERAGYVCSTTDSAARQGSRLAKKDNIKARVKELQELGAQKTGMKIADVIEMLIEDRRLARKADQAGAAVRATELIGKQLGMFVERKEIKTGPLDGVDMDVLDAIREQLISESKDSLAKGDRRGEVGTEDRDVLPREGSVSA